jgi:hypothetical protein
MIRERKFERVFLSFYIYLLWSTLTSLETSGTTNEKRARVRSVLVFLSCEDAVAENTRIVVSGCRFDLFVSFRDKCRDKARSFQVRRALSNVSRTRARLLKIYAIPPVRDMHSHRRG